MSLTRSIPNAPQYTITRSGQVRHISNRAKDIPPVTHQAKYGLVHQCVFINDSRHYVWRLLRDIWYDGNLILARNGSLLNWDVENTFPLIRVSPFTTRLDADEIQLIWNQYQYHGTPCWNMGEKSGLLYYSADEYKTCIRDILWNSVR